MTEELPPEPMSQQVLLDAVVKLLKLERKRLVSKLKPSVLRGAKSGTFQMTLALS